MKEKTSDNTFVKILAIANVLIAELNIDVAQVKDVKLEKKHTSVTLTVNLKQ